MLWLLGLWLLGALGVVLAEAVGEPGALVGDLGHQPMIGKAVRRLGTGDDQTGELALEMAEQGFAQAVASRGGLGIAKAVIGNLHRNEPKAASSAPSAAQ